MNGIPVIESRWYPLSDSVGIRLPIENRDYSAVT